MVQKSLSKKTYFEITNTQTLFCFSYVNLATVQIWVQSNKFCFKRKHLFQKTASAEKNSCFANKHRRQTHSTGFSDHW